VVIISLGLFREFENILGSEVRQEKRIYEKAMLGVQLRWTDRGGKGKKHTRKQSRADDVHVGWRME
jgi:hypothetical protein